MSEAAASSADSAAGSPTKKRKRGRVSFGSDVFAAQASLQATTDSSASLRRIPLSDLAHNPRNPRYGYDDPAIQELADSLRARAAATSDCGRSGCLPRSLPGGCGSARSRGVGGPHREPPARGRPFGGADSPGRLGRGPARGADPMLAEATLVENIHRQDLPPLLEARELQGLVERHGSQRTAAKRVAKTQAWVSQRLSLLKLTPELQEKLRIGELSVKEARTVASAPPEEQAEKLESLRRGSSAGGHLVRRRRDAGSAGERLAVSCAGDRAARSRCCCGRQQDGAPPSSAARR